MGVIMHQRSEGKDERINEMVCYACRVCQLNPSKASRRQKLSRLSHPVLPLRQNIRTILGDTTRSAERYNLTTDLQTQRKRVCSHSGNTITC
ncbi:hypothetical protein MGG_17671 [Pyricularia oryzae 70-15]|nr:uncharacterized protein MGG_17671 [Pyricularia oryzae 70-15]EHA47245.1 hypothetical protein MGG_17671 [Pyricularia oryzae 70-15]KAI7929158.1 hypothetical protein M9X92_001352 [Pyricularia oryzae]KAI7930067.1 hypothetical protein M0657_001872 [Pyricularia oryzae]QBZ64494.1 hypothetical protein PoMZ_06192 [Pyricularia oryzae]